MLLQYLCGSEGTGILTAPTVDGRLLLKISQTYLKFSDQLSSAMRAVG